MTKMSDIFNSQSPFLHKNGHWKRVFVHSTNTRFYAVARTALSYSVSRNTPSKTTFLRVYTNDTNCTNWHISVPPPKVTKMTKSDKITILGQNRVLPLFTFWHFVREGHRKTTQHHEVARCATVTQDVTVSLHSTTIYDCEQGLAHCGQWANLMNEVSAPPSQAHANWNRTGRKCHKANKTSPISNMFFRNKRSEHNPLA